jgi:nucleotide-binding universal stress UspA family protein
VIVLKNILVATDFTAPSDAALAYGREFARSYGSTLHVLHVTENVTATYAGTRPTPRSPQRKQEEAEAAARARMDALITEDDRAALHVQAVVLPSTTTSEAILNYAQRHEVDLIILGTHGRSALERVRVGSVAERVVRRAPCPVMTIHHPEREFTISDAALPSRTEADR